MRQKQKGFTLIELLVVISIIGLLASIALVSLNGARVKARDTRRVADVRQLVTALNMYYNDNNTWPIGIGGYTEPFYPGTPNSGIYPQMKPYMSSVPNDPLWGSTNPNIYFYYLAWPTPAWIDANGWAKLTHACDNHLVLVVFHMENAGSWEQDCALTDPQASSVIIQ